MRCAVIDIGTNSVKLLVADVKGRTVSPVWEESEQTRLGKGFYHEHRLQRGTIEHTAKAVSQFAETARGKKAKVIRVVATSAARDARNAEDLLSAIHAASGLTVEVISGEQEADWVFDGVRSDPTLQGRQLLILDLGGGSTEFILGDREHPVFRQSFAIGTVRLMERVKPSDPPRPEDWEKCRSWTEHFLVKEVQPLLAPLLDADKGTRPLLVGTGGTTSILAAIELGLTAFDRARIEQVCLAQDRVVELQRRLWGMPLAARQTVRGLPPDRADVILFGVAVYVILMEVFELPEVRVSTRGLRFGAVLDAGARRRTQSPQPRV